MAASRGHHSVAPASYGRSPRLHSWSYKAAGQWSTLANCNHEQDVGYRTKMSEAEVAVEAFRDSF